MAGAWCKQCYALDLQTALNGLMCLLCRMGVLTRRSTSCSTPDANSLRPCSMSCGKMRTYSMQLHGWREGVHTAGQHCSLHMGIALLVLHLPGSRQLVWISESP